MADPNAILVEIPMEDGEPLGATPNDKLVIIKVQPGTVAEGKLKIGDQIVKINEHDVKDTNEFFRRLRYAPPLARLHIIRDEKKADEVKQRVHIPDERAKLIQRRDGYEYLMVKIEWKRGGPKLGLGIRHFQNRVLVSRCDPNSLSAAEMRTGDHIIDVDGKPVTDKDVARELLLKSLQTNGFATMVIERPDSMEAKQWTQTALTTSPQQPPSVAMNSDVRDIAARERAKVKNAAPGAKKGILATGGHGARANVVVNEKPVAEHVIASDNEGKALRPVRK